MTGAIIKWIAIVTVVILVTFAACKWQYYREMHQIERNLNKIEGVKVLNIWGHEDITLEEVAARIQIESKGEIVIGNLNKNDNQYPDYVPMYEIGGYSFDKVSCNCMWGSTGVGSGIDIGTGSHLGKLLNLSFENPKMIIENYDKIYFLIDSIAKVSNPVHFIPDTTDTGINCREEFISFIKKGSKDQDPIFNLIGVESRFEAAKKLPWKTDKCIEENK